MGILRRIDRRREPRRIAGLPVFVWGVDTQGERFCQEAQARDISQSGALLTGLDVGLQSGDVVGILYGKKKARYRVLWTRYDGAGERMQVAIHRMQVDECPWLDLLLQEDQTEERKSRVECPPPCNSQPQD